ncbi:MAG: FeoA domain-containing protein [Candidatus Omnitrophica bacterium]|nr:FeoA domain-containing protein [Candidatus Omnitrophota bacterium]MCM8828182.1 FeoA domain-containing protein [Candidatus Omnitrophota bacterium]
MDKEMEDILEQLWKKREKRECTAFGFDSGKIEKLKKMGLVDVSQSGVFLTEKGEGLAKMLVRRHRLWEVFLHDILGMKEFNEIAGFLEHESSGNIDEALCDFLGHPQQCPDGKPIPRGQCCRKRMKQRTGWGFFHNIGIMRLCDVPKGKKVKVVCLRGKLFPKLSGYGIIPGSIIRIQETFSGFLIKIGQSEIALDRESCADILVQVVQDTEET